MAKIWKCKNKIPNTPPKASLVHYHMAPNVSHVNSLCLHPALRGLVVHPLLVPMLVSVHQGEWWGERAIQRILGFVNLHVPTNVPNIGTNVFPICSPWWVLLFEPIWFVTCSLCYK
jgi:hypothetical protein